jgi:pimeloyl-ACP methyl ester carboxylesterase
MNPLLVKTLQFAFHWGGRVAPRSAALLAYQLFCTPPRLNGRLSKKNREVYLSAETFCVSDNGRPLKVYRWLCLESSGEEKKPLNVMLVHGWGGSARSMQAFIEPLQKSGCNVIAFDAPAHGDSSGRQTTLLNVAASLRGISGEVGPVHAMVGHSFGGMVLAAALGEGERPENLSHVARLVLIGVPDGMNEILFRYGEHIRLAPAARRHLRARIEKRAGRSVDTISTGGFIEASRIPTLVIHDNNDKEVPVTEGRAIADRSPNGRFFATEGLGHRRILRSPLVADAIVDFVRK